MSKQQIKTRKGYDLWEVVSALQKSIRRGLEKDALFWAMEMHDSGFHAYLWKRLIVISHEDVGAANLSIIPLVRACKENYYELDRGLLPLVSAVASLCRSPKSRLFDWMVCWANRSQDIRKLEIPDYALDTHTRRGKAMGRGQDHFHEEGSKLHPFVEQDQEGWYKEEVRKLPKRGAVPQPRKRRVESKSDGVQQSLPLEEEAPKEAQPRRRVRQVQKPEAGGGKSGGLVF